VHAGACIASRQLDALHAVEPALEERPPTIADAQLSQDQKSGSALMQLVSGLQAVDADTEPSLTDPVMQLSKDQAGIGLSIQAVRG
jgi:hypothetical protein